MGDCWPLSNRGGTLLAENSFSVYDFGSFKYTNVTDSAKILVQTLLPLRCWLSIFTSFFNHEPHFWWSYTLEAFVEKDRALFLWFKRVNRLLFNRKCILDFSKISCINRIFRLNNSKSKCIPSIFIVLIFKIAYWVLFRHLRNT